MRQTALIGLILFGATMPAIAQGYEDCRSIADGEARLACYDAAAKPKEAPAAPPVVASAITRRGYTQQIERIFLGAGVDISVFPMETAGDRRNEQFTKYPRLILFGYINKPFVYKAITEWKLLENAKQVGFRAIEFADKGPDGRWFFDISGAQLPNCDVNKRLCR